MGDFFGRHDLWQHALVIAPGGWGEKAMASRKEKECPRQSVLWKCHYYNCDPLAGGDRYLQLGAEGILLSLLAGGLLAAACMDGENCYVYNYVWWWCLLWTGILLGVSCGGATVTGSWERTVLTGIRQAAAVAVFVLLQQFLFARMYGRADSHAFSVCALISCRWRGEMLWFLMHMLLAVTLLALVQLGKGNVTCRGKLRTPKPFIPYIVITFWGEIVWMLCSQGA